MASAVASHASSGGGGGYARGYTGGGFSRMNAYGRGSGNYGARSYSSYHSTGRHGYGSYPAVRSSYAAHSTSYSKQSNYRNQAGITHRNQSNVTHANRVAGVHQNGNKLANSHRAGIHETRNGKHLSQQNATHRNRIDHQSAEKMRNRHDRTPGLAEARRNHHDNHHNHHDRDWWHHHCSSIVLVGWGYWGWDAGWWYPAWGYDPYYSYYDYDGPIYGYDGLPPDQVIVNVQTALQREGYFPYAVDGVLGPATEAALQRYQQDHGLSITGAVDPSTLSSLGFIT